jgi:hypothetical protein
MHMEILRTIPKIKIEPMSIDEIRGILNVEITKFREKRKKEKNTKIEKRKKCG